MKNMSEEKTAEFLLKQYDVPTSRRSQIRYPSGHYDHSYLSKSQTVSNTSYLQSPADYTFYSHTSLPTDHEASWFSLEQNSCCSCR